MQSIWYSIKISIAGAKLSHLVQKDQIWDHGSMIEQVRSVFYQLQKATAMADTEIVRKYVTIPGYESIKEQIEKDDSLHSNQQLNQQLMDANYLQMTINSQHIQ